MANYGPYLDALATKDAEIERLKVESRLHYTNAKTLQARVKELEEELEAMTYCADNISLRLLEL